MKTESGPLKYRLARKWPYGKSIGTIEQKVYEYILQGWFEWVDYGEAGKIIPYEGDIPPVIPPLRGGEWRDLETVDIE